MLTDEEIDALLKMRKTVQNPRARRLEKRGSEQVNYEVVSDSGENFRLFVRQNMRIPDGFSAGLLYEPSSGPPVILTRYNGSDHEHTNPLENGKPLPPACHIHRATARYIAAGRKSEHFAETTDRYSDVDGALRALICDCNIEGLGDNASDDQLNLL